MVKIGVHLRELSQNKISGSVFCNTLYILRVIFCTLVGYNNLAYRIILLLFNLSLPCRPTLHLLFCLFSL